MDVEPFLGECLRSDRDVAKHANSRMACRPTEQCHAALEAVLSWRLGLIGGLLVLAMRGMTDHTRSSRIITLRWEAR